MMKPHVPSILAASMVFATLSAAQTSRSPDLRQVAPTNSPLEPTSAYVFTSFRGNGETGLHPAWSTNGYHWTPLNDDRPFLRPTAGGRLMRDPCVTRGPDGAFHMLWTTGWTAEGNPGDNGYNHRVYCATTRDFLTFTELRLFYDPGFNVIDATGTGQ